MNLFKSLLLALTMLATPALAQDSFLLYSKGAWEVRYVTIPGSFPTCVAEVYTNDLYFSVDVGAGTVSAYYTNMYNQFGSGTTSGTVQLWVDQRDTWNTPAKAWNHTILMTGLHRSFIADLYLGNRLYVDSDGDGRSDAWFSLHGSAAALNALADCSSKL